jgi:hypothetical protein
MLSNRRIIFVKMQSCFMEKCELDVLIKAEAEVKPVVSQPVSRNDYVCMHSSTPSASIVQWTDDLAKLQQSAFANVGIVGSDG